MSKIYLGNKFIIDPDAKLEQIKLTLAEYDALTDKKDNILYVITDAPNPWDKIIEVEDYFITHKNNKDIHVPTERLANQVLSVDKDDYLQWKNLNKSDIGLSNVDNESKATMFTNPTFTGIPKAPTAAVTTNSTLIATTEFVLSAINHQIAANDAMLFKGVINTNNALPTTHAVGWTYKVGTTGTYAGKVCEVGDLIICNTDGTTANNDHWDVIQTNIDGAVTGPTTSVNLNIAVFDGTTGKIIKDSGKDLNSIDNSITTLRNDVNSVITNWNASIGKPNGIASLDSSGKVPTSQLPDNIGTPNDYTLPIASNNTLGGIKIGEGLNIDESGVTSIDLSSIDLDKFIVFTKVNDNQITCSEEWCDCDSLWQCITSDHKIPILVSGNWTGGFFGILNDVRKATYYLYLYATVDNTNYCLTADASGRITLQTGIDVATTSRLGKVIVGSGLSIDNNGTLSANVQSYDNATTTEDGLMSKEDKSKLDGIQDGAQVNSVTSVNGQIGDVVIDSITQNDRNKLNNIYTLIDIKTCSDLVVDLEGYTISTITLNNDVSISELQSLLNNKNSLFFIKGEIKTTKYQNATFTDVRYIQFGQMCSANNNVITGIVYADKSEFFECTPAIGLLNIYIERGDIKLKYRF